MKKNFSKVLGIKNLQFFFEPLFVAGLRGMNYGNGGNYKESGELYVLKYLNERFKSINSLTIFDVGANVGKYSVEIYNIFKTKATIHSFEPSKKTFEIFLETTKNISNVFPNNFGFSNTENNQLLFSNEDGSGLASIYHRNLEHFGITMNQSEEIKLSTIDIYCKSNNIEYIHFLKLDIEGNELKALNGAKQMICNNKIEVIQFEFGGCNIDSRTYFQDFYYLLKDNYKISLVTDINFK